VLHLHSVAAARLLALATLLVVILAGCGGGSDEDEPSAGAPEEPPATTPVRPDAPSTDGPDEAREDKTTSRPRARRRPARERGRERSRRRRAADRPRGDGGRTAAEPPESRGEQPTRSAFIRAADRHCRRFARRDRALREDAGNGPEELAAYYDALSELVTEIVERISLLPQPPADRATVDRYLSRVQRNASLLIRLADAVDRGNEGAVRVLARRIRTNGLRANRIARGYGFKACGSG
jgi:hypothetical protein